MAVASVKGLFSMMIFFSEEILSLGQKTKYTVKVEWANAHPQSTSTNSYFEMYYSAPDAKRRQTWVPSHWGRHVCTR